MLSKHCKEFYCRKVLPQPGFNPAYLGRAFFPIRCTKIRS